MLPFDWFLLVAPGSFIFSVTFVVSCFFTRSAAFSLCAALVKAFLFALYFGFLFDGVFTFLDDWNYVDGGVILLNNDVNLFNLIENWEFALMVSSGDHFIYHLYNTYAFKMFGVGYYAPVALNIAATAFVAGFGALIFRREFVSDSKICSLFFAFLLFHPDILAWSNIMNGKDIFVLLQHVVLINAVSLWFCGRKWMAIFSAAPALAILFFLRFYVPVMFVGVILLQQFFVGFDWRKLIILLIAALASYVVFDSLIGHLLYSSVDSFMDKKTNPIIGFFKMALTPVPFFTDPDYGFLDFPALFHWLVMPFAIYGFRYVYVRKNNNFFGFMALYFFCFMVLYSFYGELQGPRHRVQLDFAWALFQFIGLRRFLIFSQPVNKTIVIQSDWPHR